MNHLNFEFDASLGDTAEVTFDRAANIMLLDASNYAAYVGGRKYRYYGGYATRSPARLAIPSDGHWHVVVDLGGGAGRVRATVQLLSGLTA